MERCHAWLRAHAPVTASNALQSSICISLVFGPDFRSACHSWAVKWPMNIPGLLDNRQFDRWQFRIPLCGLSYQTGGTYCVPKGASDLTHERCSVQILIIPQPREHHSVVERHKNVGLFPRGNVVSELACHYSLLQHAFQHSHKSPVTGVDILADSIIGCLELNGDDYRQQDRCWIFGRYACPMT